MLAPSLSEQLSKRPSAWLFCRVIDNYGDIGVAWRLAGQLAARGFQVALWHDHPPSLAALLGNGVADGNIRVHLWQDEAEDAVAQEYRHAAPALVVETFACDLPAAVLAVIREVRPLWLNWEYLSAEDWAEAMHGKPSLQADGTAKYFWLMGFSPRSGALLREADYVQRRQVFLSQAAAQATLRQQLGLPESPVAATRRWLCFGYAGDIWALWLAAWQAWGQPLECWLAGSQIIDSLRAAGAIPAQALRQDGDVWQAGNVRLVRIAFVPQRDFDGILHLADGVVVRGEDSFVRAQLAGKPMLWHIYPQEEMAHAVKLHAFWQQYYRQTGTAPWADAHRRLSDEINGVAALDAPARAAAWATLLDNWPAWQQATTDWQQYLLAQSDTISRLLAAWPHWVQERRE